MKIYSMISLLCKSKKSILFFIINFVVLFAFAALSFFQIGSHVKNAKVVKHMRNYELTESMVYYNLFLTIAQDDAIAYMRGIFEEKKIAYATIDNRSVGGELGAHPTLVVLGVFDQVFLGREMPDNSMLIGKNIPRRQVEDAPSMGDTPLKILDGWQAGVSAMNGIFRVDFDDYLIVKLDVASFFSGNRGEMQGVITRTIFVDAPEGELIQFAKEAKPFVDVFAGDYVARLQAQLSQERSTAFI